MSEEFEIKNRIAESGLINFDISDLVPSEKRIGIDIKHFLFKGLVLKEKDFRKDIDQLDLSLYQNNYVYIFCSADAIVPLWAYFLVSARLSKVAKKVIFGNAAELEMILMHDVLEHYDFSTLKNKRVLVKGCSDKKIPENAYVELVQKLQPLVKSLMFGEACSNVPIFKN